MNHTGADRTGVRWRRPALGIRWRLTLWYLVILSLVLLVFGGIVYETQANSIRSQLNDELRVEADNLASSYDPSNGQFDLIEQAKPDHEPTVPPVTRSTQDEQKLAVLKQSGLLGAISNAATPGTSDPIANVTAHSSTSLVALGGGGVAFLVNPGGKILTRFGSLSDADLKRLADQVAVIGPPRAGTTTFTQSLHVRAVSNKSVAYRFYTTPLLVKDIIFGTLVVGVPDKAPVQLHRLLVTILVAAPITLLIAAAGGYWLATRAMRPVRVISNTVQSIGATDLSRRLNLGTRDELGELAATFDQMLDRLEAAFKRQRQFTSDASHELRTPLTIVQLELEHAQAGNTLPAGVARALSTIQTENEYMSRLVNDLLILARADAGRAALGHELLDLSELVLAAVERLASLAREKGIALNVGDLPELDVLGDPAYLIQMLTNVVENAIRYTNGHGHEVYIETGRRNVNGVPQGWVRVADDGPGIGPEHIPHLFERFYRVDQVRERLTVADDQQSDANGGSGLGLSIVQWVARSHGGDVKIESLVGRGTTVEIWLPLESDAPSRHGTVTASA